MAEVQRVIKALGFLTLLLTFFIIISSNAVAINAADNSKVVFPLLLIVGLVGTTWWCITFCPEHLEDTEAEEYEIL